MADIYGMLDELQHRAAKEEDIKESFLQPEKKKNRSVHFAEYAGSLVMRFMKWS